MTGIPILITNSNRAVFGALLKSIYSCMIGDSVVIDRLLPESNRRTNLKL